MSYFNKQSFWPAITFLLFLFIVAPANGQDSLVWLYDFEKAQKIAQKESKYILVYFSGSDWCKPCIKMKKEIFNTAIFKEYARQNLVCVLADFPRYKKNKLSATQMKHNELLAEKYNKEGVFPQAVIISQNRKTLANTGYRPEGASGFVSFLKQYTGRQKKAFKKTFLLMGSRFEITAVATDKIIAENAIYAAEEEIKRIEKLISSWDTTSQTTAINTNAGKKIMRVDKELFDLITRSKKISALTDGAFDISFASIDKIWQFDGSMKKIPPEEAIAASVEKINFRDIILNKKDTTVFFKQGGDENRFWSYWKRLRCQ